MTDADKPAFVKVNEQLAVATRDKEPEVTQVRVYFEALRGSRHRILGDGGRRADDFRAVVP